MADASEEERQLNEAIALSLAQQPPSAPVETDEDREMREALALSMQQQPNQLSQAALGNDEMALDIGAMFADADAGGPSLARLVFGDSSSGEVMRQWKSQGFVFADVDLSETPGTTPFSAGLAQEYWTERVEPA